MASFILYDFDSLYAQVSASATTTSDTSTSATIKITASGYIPVGYWTQSSGVVVKMTINGSTSQKTLFGNGTRYDGSEGAKTQTYSISVSKTTSKQSISWKVEFWNASDGSLKRLEHTESGTISVSAKPSYTVSYNANGGTGAPSSQTKWYNTTLTLSSTKPSRTGYSFQGWATSASGSVAYASGASYTTNAALSLYAVWKANTYTVSYNANGGSGAPSPQTKTYGVTLTLSSTKPTRTNYNFLGWATSASGSVVYSTGASYTSNAAVTLYAVWQLAYVKPRITGLSVVRCNSSGTATTSGTYAKVSFSWATDKTVSSIKIAWGSSSTTVSASGTSGSVSSKVVGDGGLSVDSAYTFTVTVADSNGSTSAYTTLTGMAYVIDFKSGGDGVAVGKAASKSGYFESQYNIQANQKLVLGNYVDTSTPIDAGIKIHDLREVTPTGDMFGNYSMNVYFDTTDVDSGWKSILHLKGWTGSYAAHQLAFNAHNSTTYSDLYHRTGVASSWTSWKKILDSSNYSSYALPKSGGTVSGNLTVSGTTSLGTTNISGILNLTRTTDAEATTDNGPALIVGTRSGAHIEIDTNEIIAKSSGTASTTLYLNSGGGNVNIKGFNMCVNNVLWSGGSYMTADQTITLSSGVTSQPHGVVLVWSAYTDGAAANQNFTFVFIPKYYVSAHSGKGVSCWMNNATGSIVGVKYVYVSDTTIKGYSHNADAETWQSSNFNVTPRYFVLRYVIGV